MTFTLRLHHHAALQEADEYKTTNGYSYAGLLETAETEGNLFGNRLKNIGRFFFDVLYISLLIYNRTDTWPTNPQLQYLTTGKTLSYIFVSLIHLRKKQKKMYIQKNLRKLTG